MSEFKVTNELKHKADTIIETLCGTDDEKIYIVMSELHNVEFKKYLTERLSKIQNNHTCEYYSLVLNCVFYDGDSLIKLGELASKNNHYALNTLGTYYLSNKQYAEAKKYFEKAIAHGSVVAYVGHSLFYVHGYCDIKIDIHKAIEICSKGVSAQKHYNLGCNYRTLEDNDNAIKQFTLAYRYPFATQDMKTNCITQINILMNQQMAPAILYTKLLEIQSQNEKIQKDIDELKTHVFYSPGKQGAVKAETEFNKSLRTKELARES